MLRDTYARNADSANFRLFCPDETNSNRLGAVFEVENRCFVGRTLPIDDHVAPDGRVMEVLSKHLCEGWLEDYLLRGRHRVRLTGAQMTADTHLPEVVSPEEWLAARKDLLVKEKEATRARDRVNADRRRLPMVRIDEPIDRADG